MRASEGPRLLEETPASLRAWLRLSGKGNDNLDPVLFQLHVFFLWLRLIVFKHYVSSPLDQLSGVRLENVVWCMFSFSMVENVMLKQPLYDDGLRVYVKSLVRRLHLYSGDSRLA